MINSKLDRILKLITPVIAVSKEMQKEHEAEIVAVVESPELMGASLDDKPKKKAKKAKKVAKKEDELA